jgi:hypothetical protein
MGVRQNQQAGLHRRPNALAGVTLVAHDTSGTMVSNAHVTEDTR